MKNKLILTSLTILALTSAFAFADAAPQGIPKSYPLKKCVVSDEALGEHGKSVKVSYKGTDVYLCCKDCVKDFNKEPEKYVKMVKAAQPKK